MISSHTSDFITTHIVNGVGWGFLLAIPQLNIVDWLQSVLGLVGIAALAVYNIQRSRHKSAEKRKTELEIELLQRQLDDEGNED